MKIMRDGKEYELTSEELAAANTEFVTNFMKSELMGRCEILTKNWRKSLLSRHTTDIAKETARQKESVSIGRIIPGSNPYEKNDSAA